MSQPDRPPSQIPPLTLLSLPSAIVHKISDHVAADDHRNCPEVCRLHFLVTYTPGFISSVKTVRIGFRIRFDDVFLQVALGQQSYCWLEAAAEGGCEFFRSCFESVWEYLRRVSRTSNTATHLHSADLANAVTDGAKVICQNRFITNTGPPNFQPTFSTNRPNEYHVTQMMEIPRAGIDKVSVRESVIEMFSTAMIDFTTRLLAKCRESPYVYERPDGHLYNLERGFYAFAPTRVLEHTVPHARPSGTMWLPQRRYVAVCTLTTSQLIMQTRVSKSLSQTVREETPVKEVVEAVEVDRESTR